MKNLFRAESSFCIFNNNSYEILGQRQQGEVLTSVRGEYRDLVWSSGYDNINLGRWNLLDLYHNWKKIRIVTAYRYVKSRQSENTVYH